jgi:ATP-dependent helicase/nuclease subunit A
VYLSNEAGIVFSSPAPLALRRDFDKRNNYFWQRAKDETGQKRLAELRRLLYVGMTRAEKELYITGSLEIKDADDVDNFSLLIKNHIEEKCAGKENKIEGDSILNDDTFFGLLLPSIICHIPLDGIKKDSGFFDIEEIPIYTEENIRKQESKAFVFSNDQKGLNEFIKKAESCYDNAEIIKTDICKDNHKSPVSLKNAEDEKDSGGIFINKDFSGSGSSDVFKKVDSLLARFSGAGDEYAEKINSAALGTITHICIEAYLAGVKPVIPPNISGSLTPAEAETLLEAGKKLAQDFVNSPLGKIAENVELCESEFSFRSIVKNQAGQEVFINGTIDLFFEDNTSFHIIDFKTDAAQTPQEHRAQMACYYQAITALFAVPAKKDCRVWLYYLRTGNAVEMTENVKQFDLEKRIWATLKTPAGFSEVPSC